MARLTNASGSSTKTSMRTVVVPTTEGLSQPFLAGSARKKGAPPISRPTTEPMFHSSVAPRTRVYHSVAARASGTATMRLMTVWEGDDMVGGRSCGGVLLGG